MNILITGAKGFIGKNLIASLENIKQGKDRTRALDIGEIFQYDLDTDSEQLRDFCNRADFVFNLAGINRPKDTAEFMKGNCGFACELLDTLKECGNSCPVMLASSIQASLVGRYEGSSYGESKLAGEECFFEYAKETGAKILIYRFVNVFGKWCRPNYNSVVATFCNNIANDLPIVVNDSNTQLELVYIDDLIDELLNALEGREHRCEFEGVKSVLSVDGKYCCVPVTYQVSLGEIVELLERFKRQPETLIIPEIEDGSFAKKLYSTYLSYVPPDQAIYTLKTNRDARGSFTELIKSSGFGQVSVNVIEPAAVKGQHWHHSKWEIFIVVSGHGLIKQRRIDSCDVTSYEVWGKEPRAIQMLPGYTHSIENLSDTEPLVTVMWANEPFDSKHPDTFYEEV